MKSRWNMAVNPEALHTLLVASRDYIDREQVKAGHALGQFLAGDVSDVFVANDALYRLGCLYALDWSKFTPDAPPSVLIAELVPLVEVEPEDEISFD